MRIGRRQFLIGAGGLPVLCILPGAALAEPITLAGAAGFVAAALLAGAISYVGGQVMARALGAATIDDVKTWIQEAVREIEAYISAKVQEELDDQVLQQMSATLSGIRSDLTQYAALNRDHQKQNRYLLDDCDLRTASLIPLALHYDPALYIALTAMAYRLFCLQGHYLFDKDPGHITSARSDIDNFLVNVKANSTRIQNRMDPTAHVTISCVSETETCGPPPTDENGAPSGSPDCSPVPAYCFISVDGTTKSRFPNEDSPTNPAVQAGYNELAKPFRDQQAAFVSAVQQNVSMIVKCYDKMMRQIGQRYAPAESIVPKGVLSATLETPTLRMPGAFVDGARVAALLRNAK
jgi:hypothetical protein